MGKPTKAASDDSKNDQNDQNTNQKKKKKALVDKTPTEIRNCISSKLSEHKKKWFSYYLQCLLMIAYLEKQNHVGEESMRK